MKKIWFCFLLLICMSGCATVSTEEVGQGLTTGGIATGSSGIAVIGIATELVGRAVSTPAEGSPEFEKRKAENLKKLLPLALSIDYYKGITTVLPDAELSSKAEKHCADLADKVVGKMAVGITRETTVMLVPAPYRPEIDGDKYFFLLAEDPFGGKCVAELTEGGRRRVAKIKSGK